MNTEQVLKCGDHEVVVADLSDAGIAYLLAYGFRQSVQDVIAGKAKAMKDETVSAEDSVELGVEPDTKRWNDAEIASALHDLQTRRVAAIVSGDIGLPRAGGPKAETMLVSIAVERLRAKLAKANTKLPTGDKTIRVNGKDVTREQLVAAEIAKYGDAIREEIARRKSEVQDLELAELDI